MFDFFFSDDTIDLIVEQTELYATQDKNKRNIKTDRDKIKNLYRLGNHKWI